VKEKTEVLAVAFNKVEICGVNTSKLRAIPESRKKELLQIIKNGEPEEAGFGFSGGGADCEGC
ncbi:MAG: hypothetical protein VZR73_08120, partial [Acutalibacteraceae bacterium]|nr:hypothetical protein [Acutalibacteraceae bacterium]